MLVYKMSLKFCIIIESKSPKTFFAIVLYTNMAAVTSREHRKLARSTAVNLVILQIGPSLMNVRDASQIMTGFKEVFKDIGKLKDYQLKLQINPSVKQVVQPARRITFSLMEKVKVKVYDLIGMDITETVEGPTPWVSQS